MEGVEVTRARSGDRRRGGTPTAADRLLATRMGVAAIDAATKGATKKFTAVRGSEIVLEDFKVMAGKTRFVPQELLDAARGL